MQKPGAWPRQWSGEADPPRVNGAHYPQTSAPDLQMGLTLGQLLSGQDRQIFVSELIADKLDQLPSKIAEQLSRHAPTPPAAPTSSQSEKLSPWQIAQLVMAAIVVASAVITKTPLKDVIPSLMKPIG